MFASFSLPMKAERSRNKERLEANLAGLCELELLKQRQEARVLGALCLGDSPRPPWGALRAARCALDAPGVCAAAEQHSSLRGPPRGLGPGLEQQVSELSVGSEEKTADPPADLEDGALSSDPVQQHLQSPEPKDQSEVRWPVSASEGGAESGETGQADPARGTAPSVEMRVVDPGQEDFPKGHKVETYIFGLIQRRALQTRSSKLRTSLAHDARAAVVARQHSFCCRDESKPGPVLDVSTSAPCPQEAAPQPYQYMEQERHTGAGLSDSSPPPYLHHPLQHQQGLHLRLRQAPMVSTSCSTLLDYPSFRVLQAHPDSGSGRPDSPQQYHCGPAPAAPPGPFQQPLPDDQLVSAEYIPAQPCRASTRANAHHHANPNKASGPHKPSQSAYSPDRGHHNQEQHPVETQIQPSRYRGGAKKCRSGEDRGGAGKKSGRKACRSQSENSLQRAPDRKYSTVERDGGGSGSGGRGSRSSQSRSKKHQHGGGNARRWQSTQELSQDEAEQPPEQVQVQGPNHRDQCGRRTRKSRSTHAPFAYQYQHLSRHQQHMDYQFERDQQPGKDYPHPGQGETESSMSEADSPDSSSLSSDSDESGGLVWPQQLPPHLPPPSPAVLPGASLQPKAFVKIKASHALKKKILRFRTGSLKVMTTV